MHAVICGAGIAGLAAAISVDKHGWDVTVVERAATLRDGGYMIDFFGPGYDAAERIGLLPALQSCDHDVEAVDWVDTRGRTLAQLHYSRLGAAMNGRLLPLLRGDVETTLFNAIPDSVDVRFADTVTSTEPHPDGVRVHVGEEVLEADLLVGADGIHSGIREQVFGPERDYIRPLGLHTAAWFFDSAAVGEMTKGRYIMLNVPHRMAGVYELEPGRHATFLVWTDDSLDIPADPLAKVRKTFGDIGGFVPAMLAADPVDDVYYDIVAQTQMPSWHKGRVVLVGDACYAVSLVAGQGASMAVAGGVALGEALDTVLLAESGATIEQTLDRFEAALRPAIHEKQAGGRRTAKWFVPTSDLRIAMRNFAFRIIDTPGLTKLLSPALSLDAKGFTAPTQAKQSRPGLNG